MLIVALAKHSYTLSSHGYGRVWPTCIEHAANLPFLYFDLTLKILPVQSTRTVTVEQTLGCMHAYMEIYISCTLCRVPCLYSVILLSNPLHLTAGKPEKLKYSAWSELFSMTDQRKRWLTVSFYNKK